MKVTDLAQEQVGAQNESLLDAGPLCEWVYDYGAKHQLVNKNLKQLKPYANLKRRQTALGEITDFIKDKLITYLTENAENIFVPKRILTSNDWLATQKETD